MTQSQIDTILKAAQHSGLTPEKLGAELTQSPYNLTPPEATQIMDQYRRMPALRIPIVRTLPPASADISPRSGGILNRSAVKKYALLVSKEKRAGKFTRVGSDFFDAVEASLESAIRGLHEAADAPETKDTFITGKAVKRAAEKLNKTARGIIFRRVMSQPTLGVTLK